MNKFERRLFRIGKKKYHFVSCETFCRVRDYFRARYEQVDKPPDLEDRYMELNSLLKKPNVKKDPIVFCRAREIVGSSEAMWLKVIIPDTIEYANRSPMGCWVPKDVAELYVQNDVDARKYFEDRDKLGKREVH